MVFIDVLSEYPDYKELLERIDKSKNVDKDSKRLLRNIVLSLREFGNKLKQIETKISIERNETELWENYKQLQSQRLSLLNLQYRWKNIWVPRLDRKFNRLVPSIEDAIEELSDYTKSFEHALRAYIDILEIRKSRENREYMRRIGFLTLLVGVAIPYVTVWERFVTDLILKIKFPVMTPLLNWVASLLLLAPAFWVLWRGWIHLESSSK